MLWEVIRRVSEIRRVSKSAIEAQDLRVLVSDGFGMTRLDISVVYPKP